MLLMEADVVHGIHDCRILRRGVRLFPMALETEVETCILIFDVSINETRQLHRAWDATFAEAYCMATRPSILPIANPFAAGKHAIVRVCHFRGETRV